MLPTSLYLPSASGRRQVRYLDAAAHRRRVDALTRRIGPGAPDGAAFAYSDGAAPLNAPTVPLREFFARVAVISRRRSADGWHALLEHLTKIDWPFQAPERVLAIDPLAVTPPMWWRADARAWARYRTHLRVIEDALTDGLPNVLLVDESVRFEPEFGEVMSDRLTGIAHDDCEVLFADRAQAYGLGGRYLRAAYDYLADYPGRSPAFHPVCAPLTHEEQPQAAEGAGGPGGRGDRA